jgi:transketolase
VKGKGVPFMENDNSWHKRVPTKEQYEEAMRILSERVT